MSIDAASRIASHAIAGAQFQASSYARSHPQTPPDGSTSYTVQQNDSFYGIAEAHLRHNGIQEPSHPQIVAYSEQIAQANDYGSTDGVLLEGQTLVLPPINDAPSQPAPAPAPAPAPPAPYDGAVNAADGIDDTEAAYVLSENFETIDTSGNGTVSFEELQIYAASADPNSIEGQAATRLVESRDDGSSGIYQQLDYGAGLGQPNDGHISSHDLAEQLAITPMPQGLDASGQAAYIEGQLRAINRAVANDQSDSWGKGDAADLVEIVMGNAALGNPAVANAIDLDTATASAMWLVEKSDNPAALVQMNNILLLGVERNHAANNDPANDAAIRAMNGLFARYLDQADVGNDPEKMQAAVTAFITDSGLAQSSLSPYSIGVFNGAIVSGGLKHVEAVADKANEKNGLFGAMLQGAAIGFSLAAAAYTGPAGGMVAYTALSEGFGLAADAVRTDEAQTGAVYDLAGQFKLGFETLDANGAWTSQQIDEATRGMETAINLGGHAS